MGQGASAAHGRSGADAEAVSRRRGRGGGGGQARCGGCAAQRTGASAPAATRPGANAEPGRMAVVRSLCGGPAHLRPPAPRRWQRGGRRAKQRRQASAARGPARGGRTHPGCDPGVASTPAIAMRGARLCASVPSAAQGLRRRWSGDRPATPGPGTLRTSALGTGAALPRQAARGRMRRPGRMLRGGAGPKAAAPPSRRVSAADRATDAIGRARAPWADPGTPYATDFS